MSADRAPGAVAYAVTRGDEPQVFVAQDEYVLSRVLALRLVAATPAGELTSSAVEPIRAALLDRRWADALVTWMEATGIIVDAYPSETVWTDEQLDEERTSFELRVAAVFEDRPDDAR